MFTSNCTRASFLGRVARPVLGITAGIAAISMAQLVSPVGGAVARADDSHERQACALMDDFASSMRLGESPPAYAIQVLSTQMPTFEADRAVGAAAAHYCPNHAADLPPGWGG